MIRKLVRQMLAAQIVSALTVSLCLLIDNVMIGRFLGVNGLAAYGWANPLLLIIGAVASMLSAGVQVVCSKSLGSGSQEETNKGYSSAVAAALGVSLLLTAAVIIFRDPLATMLGAGSEGEVFKETSDYLAGFVLGAPGSIGALVLVPFMQMAGKSGLLIAAVLGMTAADIGLDLLNVYVFHGGMFGMGLASALSYYVAVLVGLIYFLSSKCVFRFSVKAVTLKKIRELFVGGIPSVFNMVSTVIMVFAVNHILEATDGHDAVAAFSLLMTIGNAANCISTGIGGVSLTLSGILYHEEDRTGLRELLSTLSRASVLLGLTVGAALALGAPVLVGIFLPGESAARQMAVWGLRLFAAGLLPCCLNNALKNAYQGTGRVLLTECISMTEGALLPVLVAFIFSRWTGTSGVWLFFALGEAMTLLLIVLLVKRNCKGKRLSVQSFLLLRPDFGVRKEDLLEMNVGTRDEAAEAARRAEQFCLDHGQTVRFSNRISLCVEEMATNTVLYGFLPGEKHHLSVRVQTKGGQWVLRFRDDCTAFDPIHYVPGPDRTDAVGIRLVLKMADDIRYTYSLSMNNLMIALNEAAAPEKSDI